jgi:hypothetical protein
MLDDGNNNDYTTIMISDKSSYIIDIVVIEACSITTDLLHRHAMFHC